MFVVTVWERNGQGKSIWRANCIANENEECKGIDKLPFFFFLLSLSIDLSIYLSIYLFIFLSICLSNPFQLKMNVTR